MKTILYIIALVVISISLFFAGYYLESKFYYWLFEAEEIESRSYELEIKVLDLESRIKLLEKQILEFEE